MVDMGARVNVLRIAPGLFAALLVSAGLGTTAWAEPVKRTLAVYPLQPLGTDPEVVELLEDIVNAEIRALGNVILVPLTEVATAIERESEEGRECRGGTGCLAAFGRTLGADLLFYCTVATLGGSYALDAKLIDNRNKSVIGRNSVTLKGEQALLIKGVRELAVQLVAPDQYVGTLDLRVAQEGAAVLVDEVAVGTTPLAPLTTVAPGKHVLRVVREDHPDFERFVDVAFGRTTVLNVDLDSGEASAASAPSHAKAQQAVATSVPASPPFLFPVGVGALATGGVVLIGATLSAGQLLLPWFGAMQHTRQTDSGQTVVTDRDSYQTEIDRYHAAEGFWWLGVGLGTVGAALVAAGAGALVWDMTAAGEGGTGE